MLRATAATLLIATALPAFADIEVRFVEGAPTDRFDIVNTAACATGPAQITIDLAGSAAGLIFDTTGAGAGVQVFQPFRLTAGAAFVQGVPKVLDGDQTVTVQLADLPPGQTVSFTIDVDDTIGQREITVSDAEITGAAATDGQSTGRFDQTARAVIPRAACLS